MHISWTWLGRHVDLTGADPFSLIGRFTMAVAEVEGVEAKGDDLAAVIAGRVLEVRPHPTADKLKIARVATGREVVEVVCGAPNCEAGGTYPLALPGVKLPAFTVEAATLRGVVSQGVLCSERDLGLTDDHAGLLVLGGHAAPGARLPDLLPVRDVLFEIDNKSITHRPDLWGHRGMAREVGVLLDRPLKPAGWAIAFPAADALDVVTECPDLCPRYTAARYACAPAARSPFWLRLLLERAGVRAISDLVDLTNFVMLDLGNPVHAFDARLVRGNRIRIRRALAGERLTTLDGLERVLTADDCVIADGEGAVALAGVMGGESSGIRDDTTDVVLEAANFHPGAVRRTSLRLGLRTEASARFEKSLDPALALDAQLAFGALLAELKSGARATSRLVDVDHAPKRTLSIAVPAGLLEKKLGTPLPEGFAKKVLTGLGFGVEPTPDGCTITVPSWRATKDVSIKEDLVEEVGRFFGYDNIPAATPAVQVREPQFRLLSEARWATARALALAAGMTQLQTYSFASNGLLSRLGVSTSDAIGLANPISSDLTHLRTMLAPNLVGVVADNSRSSEAVRAFEIGRVFLVEKDAEGLPLQPQRVGLVTWRRDGDDEVYFELKGALEALFARLRIEAEFTPGLADAAPYLHPSKSASISAGGRTLGWLALLHPRAAEATKLATGRTALAELDLGTLAELWQRRWAYSRLPRFPGVRYEISAIVPFAVTHAELQREIRSSAGSDLRDVSFLGEYHGAPIAEGRKSMSYEMLFGRDERTLTDDEANAVAARVIAHLKATLGATLREA